MDFGLGNKDSFRLVENDLIIELKDYNEKISGFHLRNKRRIEG